MSQQDRKDPEKGTTLITVVAHDDHADIDLSLSQRLLTEKRIPGATERDVITDAMRVVYAYGRRLIDEALAQPSMRRDGYNVDAAFAALPKRATAIFTFQVFVPAGQKLEPSAAKAQIIPHAGVERMVMREWNALVGRHLMDAAFGNASTAPTVTA